MDSREHIVRDLAAAMAAQTRAVADWHEREPEDLETGGAATLAERLLRLVLAQHLMNFRLYQQTNLRLHQRMSL
jgi:hypothetical protein